MKKIFAIIISCIMVSSLVACGNAKSNTTSTTAEENATAGEDVSSSNEESVNGIVTAYSCHNLSEPYCQALSDSIEDTITKAGGTYSVTDAAQDVGKQVNQIEDLISKKIDILFVTPCDSESLGAVLQEVKDAGIKVVNIDSAVCEADQSLVDCIISSDNYQAGVLMATDILKRFPNGCKIAYLDVSMVESIHQRFVGMLDTLDGHEGFEFVSKECASTATIVNDTEDLIQANDGIQVFAGFNDVCGMSMYATAMSAGLTDFVAYGVDGSPSGKQAIADGDFTATIAQSPINMGIMAGEAAISLYSGREIEQKQYCEMIFIDADNVAEFGTDGWQ